MTMFTLLSTLQPALFAARRTSRMNFDALPSLILGLTALGIFVAIACYVLSRIRAGQKDDSTSPNEALTRFSDLYEAGEITKEEYEAIRTRLTRAIAIQAELRAAEREKNGSGLSSKKKKRSKSGSQAFNREAELERLLKAESEFFEKRR